MKTILSIIRSGLSVDEPKHPTKKVIKARITRLLEAL